MTQEAFAALPVAAHATRPYRHGPYRALVGKGLIWYWIDPQGATQSVCREVSFVTRPPYRPRLNLGDRL